MRTANLLLILSTLACGHAAPAPTTLTVAEAPNGLWWDSGSRTLFIADEASGRVVGWRDDGTAPAAVIPDGKKSGLGQVVRLADGTLVVPRFGHGEDGAIIVLAPDGSAHAVGGLSSKRRRIGLAPAAGGKVYSAWFDKEGERSTGGVSEVSLAGGERDLAGGLEKPIGLAISDGSLYVSDQATGAVLRCPTPDYARFEPVAKVAAPDLLAPGPGGAVLVASKSAGVTLVCPDGHSRNLVAAVAATRGVAYDSASHRLFVVEHEAKRSTLRVVPMNIGDRPCAVSP